MKIYLTSLFVSIAYFATSQTVTDSLNTTIGDFILVSSEVIIVSSGVTEETSSTSDGGTVELISPSPSGSRIAAPTIVSQLNIRLLPNPSSGVVELNISGVEGLASIVVTNVLGQIIYSANITIDNTGMAYLPAQLWASGTYIVLTNADGQTASERLIVE